MTVSLGVATPQESDPPWQAEIIADGLDYPWDIETDGAQLFITEKGGTVLTLNGGEITRIAIETLVPIGTDGGRGLLGMALAADFETSGRAFFYQSTASGNRVIEAVRDVDRRHRCDLQAEYHSTPPSAEAVSSVGFQRAERRGGIPSHPAIWTSSSPAMGP